MAQSIFSGNTGRAAAGLGAQLLAQRLFAPTDREIISPLRNQGITQGLRDFSPQSFTSPGLTGTFQDGTFNLARNPLFSESLGGLTNAFQTNADFIRSDLLPQVEPGVGGLTQARLGEIENRRRRSVGNLRENLSRRRVLGSSFATDALARADAEFAQEAAEAKAQGFLQELELKTKLSERAFDLERQKFQTNLDQLNFEGELAANVSASATKAEAANTSALSELLANLASQEAGLLAASAQGTGQFLGQLFRDDIFGQGAGTSLLDSIFGGQAGGAPGAGRGGGVSPSTVGQAAGLLGGGGGIASGVIGPPGAGQFAPIASDATFTSTGLTLPAAAGAGSAFGGGTIGGIAAQAPGATVLGPGSTFTSTGLTTGASGAGGGAAGGIGAGIGTAAAVALPALLAIKAFETFKASGSRDKARDQFVAALGNAPVRTIGGFTGRAFQDPSGKIFLAAEASREGIQRVVDPETGKLGIWDAARGRFNPLENLNPKTAATLINSLQLRRTAAQFGVSPEQFSIDRESITRRAAALRRKEGAERGN